MEGQYDAAEVADFMPDGPNVWSDGSCVTDDLAIISVAGAGVFSVESGMAWHSWNWRHLDDVPLENGLGGEGCRLFCSVPGHCSQKGLHACCCGVDNQNVVNHMGSLISGPFFWLRMGFA